MLADVRFAGRMVRRAPGFTAIAVLVLALGVGATGAVFTLADAVLLAPLPFPESERLAVVYSVRAPEGDLGSVSYPDFRDLRRTAATNSDSLEAARDLLGHETTAVTARHYKVRRRAKPAK